LLGAIGGPKWGPSSPVRPEQGLLRIRRELGVYANLRPIKLHPALRDSSAIKPEVLDGVDLVFVRELTGGIYFGEKTRTATLATDLCSYSAAEIERITRVAGRLAMSRRKRIVSIDKSNVLETSRLWREVAERVIRAEFPEVALEHMLVDSAAMHLIKRPRDFDVLVTENMFGDILTDEGAMLASSLGLLPSASLGDGNEAGAWIARNLVGFLKPPFNVRSETAANNAGYILATSAGFVQGFVYGLTGLRINDKGVSEVYRPVLPDSWRSLTLKNVSIRGARYDIVVSRDASGKVVLARKPH
jgi:3-isopropylmalate dehydrogenase